MPIPTLTTEWTCSTMSSRVESSKRERERAGAALCFVEFGDTNGKSPRPIPRKPRADPLYSVPLQRLARRWGLLPSGLQIYFKNPNFPGYKPKKKFLGYFMTSKLTFEGFLVT
jgi:hypothetical protein